jgi:osmotically-inducible protein OsmY
MNQLRSYKIIRECLTLLWILEFCFCVPFSGNESLNDDLKPQKEDQESVDTARKRAGVGHIETNTVVQPAPFSLDEDIEKTLWDALYWNPVLERYEINVVVLDKKIYLYGRVDSEQEKEEAEREASRVPGVEAVTNNIMVADVWVWKPDEKIRENVEQLLTSSNIDEESEINVSVRNGIATLEGQVDDMKELDATIKNAFEGGARRVVNQMKIANSKGDNPHQGFIFLSSFDALRWTRL